jgi:hypothetical protein
LKPAVGSLPASLHRKDLLALTELPPPKRRPEFSSSQPRGKYFVGGQELSRARAPSLTRNRTICRISGNSHFSINEKFLLDFKRLRLVRYFGSDDVVSIPSQIEVFCDNCSCQSTSQEEVIFVTPSNLKRIEQCAFWYPSLKTIHLPASLQIIDPSARVGCALKDLQVSPNNPHFTLINSFLLDKSGRRMFRYYGDKPKVEILEEKCFSHCTLLWEVEFGQPSASCKIEREAFDSYA